MKNVLVVVDMQNDFIDGALGTKEAKEIVNRVADKISGFDGDIFVTLDTHNDAYLKTQEGKRLPVVHCVKGTHGWELNEKVRDALDKKSYTAIEKVTFGSTALPEVIKNTCDISDIRIELVGVCTDICVVSNAVLLKANFPEISISVDANCCAGVTSEKHRAAIEIMESCQIDVREK